LPEGDWNGPLAVTCCATGIAGAGGATVTVTGGGAVTVTVVTGVAVGVDGATGVGVDIEITGVSVGTGAVDAPVAGAHAASAVAASATSHTWGRRAVHCEFLAMLVPPSMNVSGSGSPKGCGERLGGTLV
jgi:hypothetical protein